VTNEWEQLRKLLYAGDFIGIIRLVRELDDANHRGLGAPLVDFERQHRRSQSGILHFGLRSGLALAAIGVLPTPARLAPWLRRYELNRAWFPDTGMSAEDPVELGFDLLRNRDKAWLADLVVRLVDGPEVARTIVDLVAGLVRLTDLAPPPTDGLVVAWAERNKDIRPDELEPLWDEVLLRTFEVEEAGAFLQSGGIATTVVALTECRRADRDHLIDLCVGALRRGGRLGTVFGYLNAYAALAPTVDETVHRARDYLPLLSDATHSAVAGMAQRELFRADDAGLLAMDVFTDACRAVFARTERKLARAQLDRLRMVLDRQPELVDDLVPTLAGAFGQEVADMRQKALTLAVGHADAVAQTLRDNLAEAAEAADLPGGFRTAAVTESDGTDSPAPVAAVVPPASTVRPFPAITTLDELATLSDLYPRSSAWVDPIVVEQLMAAFVSLSYRDRDGLRDTLFPENPYQEPDWTLFPYESEGVELFLARHLAVASPLAPPGAPFPQSTTTAGNQAWSQSSPTGLRYVSTRRVGILILRIRELCVGLVHAPRPFLLATPTSTDGTLAAEALLERLDQAAAQSWEPWDHDLTQALLRLPPDCDADIPTAARRLGTAAGRRLAEWLTTDPDERLAAVLPTLRGPWSQGFGNAEEFTSCWPLVLPWQREVVAEHLADTLRSPTDRGHGSGDLLRSLADTHGWVGPATYEALAYGLNARDQNDRACAVAALFQLIDSGDIDPAAFGERIGTLTAGGALRIGRLLPCLRDLTRAGLTSFTWQVVVAALPLPIVARRAPQRLADLIAFAVELAQDLRATDHVPHLAELAARRGSGRAVTEARRLQSTLLSLSQRK
jgi:hypothetical protein